MSNNGRQLPSLFVLWAEENLDHSFRAGIKFLLKFLSLNYPTKYLNVHSHLDEFYLLFDLLLQLPHLCRWNSSFTERFFSIRRWVCSENSRKQLQPKDVIKSLFQLCFVPYLAEKLRLYYNDVREKCLIGALNETNDSFDNSTIKLTKSDQLVLCCYPQFEKLFRCSQVFMWLSYAAGNHHSHNLLLQLFWFGQLKLSHTSSQINPANSSGFFANISSALITVFELTFQSGAFCIQFLDYWNSHVDLRRMFRQTNHQTFPPLLGTSNQNYLISNKDLCPLCHGKRVNETALASSGFVFCYSCIHDYLGQNHRCPITGFSSEREQLIRVFG